MASLRLETWFVVALLASLVVMCEGSRARLIRGDPEVDGELYLSYTVHPMDDRFLDLLLLDRMSRGSHICCPGGRTSTTGHKLN